MSKLTLSVHPTVVEKAKNYARSTGKSLSNIVEEYLKSLVQPSYVLNIEEKHQLVKELKGSVQLPKEFISYRTVLEDALLDKYLGS